MDIKLTHEQKEEIYREIQFLYTIEDVKNFIDEQYNTDINLNVSDFEIIADIFLNRKDCNLSYWSNMEMVVESYLNNCE